MSCTSTIISRRALLLLMPWPNMGKFRSVRSIIDLDPVMYKLE